MGETRPNGEARPVSDVGAGGAGVQPGDPKGQSRESLATAEFQKLGYTVRFVADGDFLKVTETDRRFRPEDVHIRDHRRFEGASDPDDMAIVYALETSDGTRGLLVDAFGVYADPAVGTLLDRMQVDKTEPPSAGTCA